MRLRRFLTALVCLSTLSFAQNVVAGTSIPDSGSAVIQAEMDRQEKLHADATVRAGGVVPQTSTMMLLVCGLAGLTAAGGRSRECDEELA